MVSLAMWLFFAAVVIASLAIDLIAHRGAHGRGRRSAALWSLAWIVLAFLFAGWVGLQLGSGAATDFISAYLMEKSLSVDNLFVFMVVFSRLRIPDTEQRRVLSWGIFGALFARAAFIAGGTIALTRWHEIVYLLGVFLIYTGYRTARADAPQARESRVLKFLRRHLPLTAKLDGHRFLTFENGRRVGTPLMLALLTIEATDVLFAVDSVPAVFAISEEPFIVYSSNVFAVLGLRALFIVLADLLRDLRYLQYGLAAILILVGVKMLASRFVHLPPYVSLIAIVVILAATIIPSLIVARRHEVSPVE